MVLYKELGDIENDYCFDDILMDDYLRDFLMEKASKKDGSLNYYFNETLYNSYNVIRLISSSVYNYTKLKILNVFEFLGCR